MEKLCIIGSLNMDLTVTLPRFHAPGETITATGFATYTGGKGGNQAVAAGRLGVPVRMVGMVGGDAYGAQYRAALRAEGVDDGCVGTADTSTGVALIEVDRVGENRIAVVAGANACMTAARLDETMPQWMADDIFLMQLELPMDTVTHAMERLGALGKRVILDPAPAIENLPEALIRGAYCLTPNETELSILSGGQPVATQEEIVRAAQALLARGAQNVVVKMGARGAMLVCADGATPVPGFAVHCVDTTAAGDSFNAGLAVALSRGMALLQAIRFANAVGALSTTGIGAQAAMPTQAQVDALIAAQGF